MYPDLAVDHGLCCGRSVEGLWEPCFIAGDFQATHRRFYSSCSTVQVLTIPVTTGINCGKFHRLLSRLATQTKTCVWDIVSNWSRRPWRPGGRFAGGFVPARPSCKHKNVLKRREPLLWS